VTARDLCYRKNLVHHLISQIETNSLSQISSTEINVLDAIYWVISSWEEVSPTCISNCFRKAGFIDSSDNNIEMDDHVDHGLQESLNIANRLNLIIEGIAADEFVCFDNSIPTEDQMIFDQDALINEIVKENDKGNNAMGIEEDDEEKNKESENEMEEESGENIPSLSYKDVMNVLKQFKAFVLINEPCLLETLIPFDRKFTEIQSKRIVQLKQTILDFYFSSNSC